MDTTRVPRSSHAVIVYLTERAAGSLRTALNVHFLELGDVHLRTLLATGAAGCDRSSPNHHSRRPSVSTEEELFSLLDFSVEAGLILLFHTSSFSLASEVKMCMTLTSS